MAKNQRSYTADERASALAALAANGGNLKHTARQLDIPRKTLAGWATGESHTEVVASVGRHESRHEPATVAIVATTPETPSVAAKSGELADKLEALAHRLIDIPNTKIDEASVSQRMVGAGIAIEKMRLLREQSTANHTVSDDGKLFGEVVAILNRAGERYRLAMAEPQPSAVVVTVPAEPGNGDPEPTGTGVPQSG